MTYYVSWDVKSYTLTHSFSTIIIATDVPFIVHVFDFSNVWYSKVAIFYSVCIILATSFFA